VISDDFAIDRVGADERNSRRHQHHMLGQKQDSRTGQWVHKISPPAVSGNRCEDHRFPLTGLSWRAKVLQCGMDWS